jgi:hypothetical protein
MLASQPERRSVYETGNEKPACSRDCDRFAMAARGFGEATDMQRTPRVSFTNKLCFDAIANGDVEFRTVNE